MAVTRIKNNQIFDKTITQAKIADATLVGTLFNPNLTLNSNVTIVGNLAVMGDSSTISSTNTYVNDPLIVFNNGFTGMPTADVGILINQNLNGVGGTNTAWIWSELHQQFEAIHTTETGGTIGVINNSGYASAKVGNISVVATSTLGNIAIENNDISAVNADGSVNLLPNGTGAVVAGSKVLPSTTGVYDIGSSTYRWNQVYAKTVDVGGAVISTSGNNVTITPPSGGQTVVANLAITGTGSSFTGNVTSGNVTITGGTINGTTIGGTTPSDATFTSIIDTGALTANGANAAISLAPTGTGTVTINPATAGTISNMAVSATTLTASGTSSLGITSASRLTTGNLQATGGAVSGVAITSSPISGSTGSFTTLAASGVTTLAATTVNGVETITDTTQSTASTNGALIVAGGAGVAKNVNVGMDLAVTGSSTLGDIVIATNSISSTGDVEISATGAVKVGALTMPQVDGTAGSVMVTDGAGHISLVSVGAATAGNVIPLGTPTTGSLIDNNPAILTFTPTTKVTDAVDKLNEILGKLVPPAPPAFPNGTLTVSSLLTGPRMTVFTQTDNTTTSSKQMAAGSVPSYKRAATYATNVLNDVGPGESGTVSVMKNGVAAGSRTITPTLTNNGTYSDLVISDNADYGTKTGKALLFWNSFDAQASGTVPAGWNEVYLTDDAAGTSNTVVWYYDNSTPGTPVVTGTTFAPTTEVTAFSSSVPHYTSTTLWTATGTATKLSGDLYPATDTFLTGTAGGSFQTPASVTYTAAGVTTPLVRNLYVASGNASFTTTVNTVDATGSSTAGPSYSVNNTYATGTGSSTPGGTVLTIKTTDTSKVNEANVVVGTFGSGGAASAVRIGGLAAGATPALSGMAAWSSSAALPAYEATVVAGAAKQDTTNYSVGYFPMGPDLSTGRSATQYITFRVQRDAVSKFDISVTGKFSGCQVAIPGSTLDVTAAPTNGWIDPTVSYGGAGVPGTGSGGNGSVGCSIGGTLTVGSNVTQSKTVTFGTESSHNSTNNYIYIRFVLAAGDSITALSFANPTH